MYGLELFHCTNLSPLVTKLFSEQCFVILPHKPKHFSHELLQHDILSLYQTIHFDIDVTNRNLAIKIKINIENFLSSDRETQNYLRELNEIFDSLNRLNIAAIILEIGEEHILITELIASFCLKVKCVLCIRIPVVFKKNTEQQLDTWVWWNSIRIQCNFNKQLKVMLDLNASELDHHYLHRWLSEPIFGIILHRNAFALNPKQQPVLRKSYQDTLRPFLILRPKLILTNVSIQSKSSNYALTEFMQLKSYLRFFMKKNVDEEQASHKYLIHYMDKLQSALQPQVDFLDCYTYEIFEKDDVKYDLYEKAIEKAYIDNFFGATNQINIVIAGAGRGPLVQASLNVVNKLKVNAKIYAIERNPVAIITLKLLREQLWSDRVQLICGDMRKIDISFKINILVSELLGSFGDNELSPECLYGLEKHFDRKFVSIPQSYTSCVAPLQYPKLISSKDDVHGDAFYDYPYVTYLVNCYEIAKAKDLFTFVHPAVNDCDKYERFGRLEFRSSQTCLLNSFVGYFRSVLYGNILLSIEPATYSKNMFSWFPIVFPLASPVTVHAGDLIEIVFWRKNSENYVWYEWALRKPIVSRVHNIGGTVYKMQKISMD